MKLKLLGLALISAVLLTGCGTNVDTNDPNRLKPEYWCKDKPSIPAASSACNDAAIYGTPPGLLEKIKANQDEYNLLIFLILFLILYIYLIILFLKWVAKIARKNRRSVVGFVWMGIFFPFITWIILLTINETDNIKSK